MKNRAKCKLCSEVIESFTMYDYIECKCGEIAIDGGSYSLKTYAKDFSNFLRIDDNDEEILVTLVDDKPKEKPTKQDLLDIVINRIQAIESLPDSAKLSNINHYDYLSLLIILESILRLS